MKEAAEMTDFLAALAPVGRWFLSNFSLAGRGGTGRLASLTWIWRRPAIALP
jgi:hypothetical protein